MMALCGYLNPQRCHNVDQASILERRRQKRLQAPPTKRPVIASCGCLGGVLVGPVQSARIRCGKTYLCRKCRQRVILAVPGLEI
jgi:hypothetical protein